MADTVVLPGSIELFQQSGIAAGIKHGINDTPGDGFEITFESKEDLQLFYARLRGLESGYLYDTNGIRGDGVEEILLDYDLVLSLRRTLAKHRGRIPGQSRFFIDKGLLDQAQSDLLIKRGVFVTQMTSSNRQLADRIHERLTDTHNDALVMYPVDFQNPSSGPRYFLPVVDYLSALDSARNLLGIRHPGVHASRSQPMTDGGLRDYLKNFELTLERATKGDRQCAQALYRLSLIETRPFEGHLPDLVKVALQSRDGVAILVELIRSPHVYVNEELVHMIIRVTVDQGLDAEVLSELAKNQPQVFARGHFVQLLENVRDRTELEPALAYLISKPGRGISGGGTGGHRLLNGYYDLEVLLQLAAESERGVYLLSEAIPFIWSSMRPQDTPVLVSVAARNPLAARVLVFLAGKDVRLLLLDASTKDARLRNRYLFKQCVKIGLSLPEVLSVVLGFVEYDHALVKNEDLSRFIEGVRADNADMIGRILSRVAISSPEMFQNILQSDLARLVETDHGPDEQKYANVYQAVYWVCKENQGSVLDSLSTAVSRHASKSRWLQKAKNLWL